MKLMQQLRELLIFCIALLGVDLHGVVESRKERKRRSKLAAALRVSKSGFTSRVRDVPSRGNAHCQLLGQKEQETHLYHDGDSRAG